jgi:hypothetical protein
MKKSYIITLDESKDKKWKELGLEPIYTAGSYFLKILTHKLEIKGCKISDNIISGVEKELETVRIEHMKLAKNVKLRKQAEAIYCLCYQDGVIHAFEHFLQHVNYGESLCKKKIHEVLKVYAATLKEKRREKRWYDVAYIEGYMNGHFYVLLNEDEIEVFPHYFDLGKNLEMKTYAEYRRSLRNEEGRKKSVTEYAVNFVKKLPNDYIMFHHTPFL